MKNVSGSKVISNEVKYLIYLRGKVGYLGCVNKSSQYSLIFALAT